MSLFNNKLSKVPLGMLDQDVQDKFTGYDTSLAQIVQQAINVKNPPPPLVAAKGDGTTDDTIALQAIINYVKTRAKGGTIYLPAGTYIVTNTINYYVPTYGLSIIGESPFATTIKYTGTAPVVFTNEQATPNQYQYGVNFINFCITSDFTTATGPKMGVTGVYVDMMNHQWTFENMRVLGFENGLIVGVHSQEGKFFKSAFSYNDTGLDLYGDQADGIDVNSCWFTANKTRGVKLSSPRPMVHNCMFATDSTYTDTTNYVDIQIGYRSVATKDKTKSSYMGTSSGNGAIHAIIRDNYFEGYNITTPPSILVQDFETTSLTFDGLTIENNYFALYARNTAIKIVNSRKAFRTNGNKLSSTATDLRFIDCPNTSGSILDINEPFVNKTFSTDQQRWLFGAKRSEFDLLPYIANEVLAYAPSWNIINVSSGSVMLDTDYDALGGIKATLTNTPSASVVVRFQLNSCPVGMVYFATRIKSDLGNNINISVNNGSTTLYALNGIPLPNSKKDLVFGFNNTAVQTIIIDVVLANSATGTVYFDETLIKHDNNSKQALFLVDTISGLRFTNKNSQVHSISPKIPYKEIADVTNKQNGYFYYGDQFFTTISNSGGYASGVTVINVADASGISVGDYMHFKSFSSNKYSSFQGTNITGNKVSSISGNSITLATGLPFAVNDGSPVMSCKVYQKPGGTTL